MLVIPEINNISVTCLLVKNMSSLGLSEFRDNKAKTVRELEGRTKLYPTGLCKTQRFRAPFQWLHLPCIAGSNGVKLWNSVNKRIGLMRFEGDNCIYWGSKECLFLPECMFQGKKRLCLRQVWVAYMVSCMSKLGAYSRLCLRSVCVISTILHFC